MVSSYCPAGKPGLFTLLATALLLSATIVNANSLLPLVERRLAYMKDVAAYKWHHQLPIEDLAREQLVVAKAVEQGLRHGLTEKSSEQFFQAQISAAKDIQKYWFERWQQQPDTVPSDSPDLKGSIRPALIDLGAHITLALAGEDKDLNGLQIEGLSRETIAALVEAASSAQRYPGQLAQVLDSGVLRVATTADYAPFSFQRSDGERAGVDIDLARDLASALAVELQWIETSWPTLMHDLHSGYFDIAMSGISVNLKRQQTAFFSSPYHRGGKTPIIRCEDSDRFQSMAAIDQRSTRLIVNPGGTNARYVEQEINRAAVRIHPDNRTIFHEIVQGRADVMITDEIEVRLQTGEHPELCAVPAIGTLTFSEKAFLLPQDSVWKAYVDAWLRMRLEQGIVDALFADQMP